MEDRDYQDLWESRDQVIREREEARDRANRYWFDLGRIERLVGATGSKETVRAVERLVKERDELLKRVETLRDLADQSAYEQGTAHRRMGEAQRSRDDAAGRARRACQTLVAEIGADGPADVDSVAERAAATIRDLRDQVADLLAAQEESEHSMHLRVRAGYDKTIADCWRAKVAEVEAEVEMLRGVGCREAKAGEPESGPCGTCLKCAEERGARWALEEAGHGLFNQTRDDRARDICNAARKFEAKLGKTP